MIVSRAMRIVERGHRAFGHGALSMIGTWADGWLLTL
jgi:hypothetical protein